MMISLRLLFLALLLSMHRVAAQVVLADPTKQPTISPTTNGIKSERANKPVTTQQQRCGCPDCTDSIWNTLAADSTVSATCGSRILWLVQQMNMTMGQACTRVAGVEFPLVCGPACNPQLCRSTHKRDLTAYPTLAPHSPPLNPYTPLYCFPEYVNRTRYSGVWGKYVVEVKEGACAPNNNQFTRNTVSLSGNQLKLQFKFANGVWQASEVRVVLPKTLMPYRYGTYKFSVKSIVQRNVATNKIVNTALPPSLVFGMFTWDDTELYSVHENWNHEVDIEISRWNISNNKDAHFVVQPPGSPQQFRFYTGKTPGTFDEGGHTYGFTWNPGALYWSTDAGGSLTFAYTTKETMLGNLPDYVQCLPANMEVRMNLWNLGGTSTPTGMTTNDVVEVVIDQFTYTPSGLSYVPDGAYCTKHCMCAPPTLCLNGVCARAKS